MVMDATDYERLIVRYLNGDLLDGDSRNLLRWVNEHRGNKELFLGIKDTWDASLKPEGQEQETGQLLLFYKKQAILRRKAQLPVWLKVSAVAAMLVIGFVTGILLQQGSFVPATQMESFMVPMGSRSRLTLADGTKVNLNSDSRLVVDDHFSPQNRIVTLTGEGYFEVSADRKHPFIVKTEKFDITVTGTKFNVSSYADDRKVSATLMEGRISLSSIDHNFILKPGEKISFDKETADHVLTEPDVQSEMAWVNNEFIFKEIAFPDLIRRLERWYDVRLVYHGSAFDSMIYSGSFKNQETIWQVLDALKLTTPIDYKKGNFREFELIYKPM